MCNVVRRCMIRSFKDNAAVAAGVIMEHISKKLEVIWHNMIFRDKAKLKCPAGVTTAVLIKTAHIFPGGGILYVVLPF